MPGHRPAKSTGLGAGRCLGVLLLALSVPWVDAAGDAPGAEPKSYEQERARFADEMALKHGFDGDELRVLLEQARYRQAIIDSMERPYEGKPWHRYRRIFLTPERISGGVDFWRQNAETLARAEAAYGVPPEVIVAILGVETSYGARIGEHRAIDALTTLGFSYPKRAEFFRGELESLLLLERDERMDPLAAVGSYAGALGKPQFIPSSYRAYAVDFDGDGRRDLWGSDADVVGSVANYFQSHGWRRGESIAFPARLSGVLPEGIEVAEKKPLEPNTTAGQLRVAGVDWRGAVPSDAPATLIRLDGPEDEYWLALANFYVITRYNHSNLYAMAVYQLSREIRKRFDGGA
jgi:membrane-bound lytic murein transglycosylase B